MEANEWVDIVTELPVDPDSDEPVLLVPRRVLRRLPWINYEDFRAHHLLSFLPPAIRRKRLPKQRVVELTQRDLSLVDRYVDAKEASREEAAPIDLDERDKELVKRDVEEFEAELASIPTGTANAHRYEKAVLRLLNMALEPDLIDGRPQQRTYEGTQVRDLIFVNDSDHRFWDFVRHQHGSLFVTFEMKNKSQLTSADLNQLHAYLGDSTGYLGFIVSRAGFRDSDFQRAIALYNRRSPHSVILSLSDAEMIELLRWRLSPDGPTQRLRETYRHFMTAIQ